MFEFACERIIPGCGYTERDDTKEKLHEQAMDHLRERHNMDYIDKPLQERLLSVGIVPVK
jgi:predicted small metal-binding protein